MNLTEWKSAVNQRLGVLGESIRTLAPGVLYGALSTATILPVVTATNGGDFSALLALGSIVSGLGGNLIANQIQAWKDRSEAALAAELTQKATTAPEWREALDTLLREFEAPRVVQAILSEADRDWFVTALRSELDAIGSNLTLTADNQGQLVLGDRNVTATGDISNATVITGDSNVVTGGGGYFAQNVTTQGGDLIGRDQYIGGDVVHGPKVVIRDTVLIADQTAAELLRALRVTKPDAEGLRKATVQYLELLLNRYRYLDFRGMGMADRVALRLPLAEMYVPLKARIEMPKGETWAREVLLAGRKATADEIAVMGERLSEPQPLLDLLAKHDGLVILGDPGAGKTTFLKYLTLLLALGESAVAGLPAGLKRRLPILVPLSAYANALAEADVALDDFLATYYRKQGVRLPLDTLLSTALGGGQALLMLDGLDEVQALEQRTLVVERVEQFFAYHRQQGNKFLLTSRIVGYREVRPTVDGLAECTLVDFDDDDIADFVTKWAHALERAVKGETTVAQQEAESEKTELLFAVAHNPGVRQLAANPLLLTILALMKRQGVALPERRVQLYDRYVETLLRHWNLARGLDRRSSRDLDVVETIRVLAPLALWMHQSSPGVGLVKREELRRQLEQIYRERGDPHPERAAQRLLQDARDHASLLLERGAGQYGFIHLTFQEYLAAVAIAQRGQSDVTPVAQLLAQHVEEPSWREVTLLTIGYIGIVQQRDVAAGETLLKLIDLRQGEAGAAVALAGEAVLDTWPGGVSQHCRTAVADALLTTMLDEPRVKAPLRARAGSALGGLGDPRDLEEMVLVPAGAFTMGGDGEYDGKPIHQVKLSAFWIGKYPVTNGRYAAFVAATGHAAPRHWRGNQPLPVLRNHPVVYVSWHDAVAYCTWLTELRGKVVRLPTEAEWEKAARGSDGRSYPWGNEEASAEHCNFGMDIGKTTPVGIYRMGASPYGCLDMAGDVWEWTSSLHRGYPYKADDGREDPDTGRGRVVRGGSFGSLRNVVRCVYRNLDSPDSRVYDIGFRVIFPTAKSLPPAYAGL